MVKGSKKEKKKHWKIIIYFQNVAASPPPLPPPEIRLCYELLRKKLIASLATETSRRLNDRQRLGDVYFFRNKTFYYTVCNVTYIF